MSLGERRVIARMHDKKISQAEIARTLSRVRSTICRKLRRCIPVLDRNKQLVGILSLGDVAVETDGNGVGEALAAISRPGGTHCQSGVQPH